MENFSLSLLCNLSSAEKCQRALEIPLRESRISNGKFYFKCQELLVSRIMFCFFFLEFSDFFLSFDELFPASLLIFIYCNGHILLWNFYRFFFCVCVEESILYSDKYYTFKHVIKNKKLHAFPAYNMHGDALLPAYTVVSFPQTLSFRDVLACGVHSLVKEH